MERPADFARLSGKARRAGDLPVAHHLSAGNLFYDFIDRFKKTHRYQSSSLDVETATAPAFSAAMTDCLSLISPAGDDVVSALFAEGLQFGRNDAGHQFDQIGKRLPGRVERRRDGTGVDEKKALHGKQPQFLREQYEMRFGRDYAVSAVFLQKREPAAVLAQSLYEVDVEKQLLPRGVRAFRTAGDLIEIGGEQKISSTDSSTRAGTPAP